MYPNLTYITLDSVIFITDTFFTDIARWEDYITSSSSSSIRYIIKSSLSNRTTTVKIHNILRDKYCVFSLLLFYLIEKTLFPCVD